MRNQPTRRYFLWMVTAVLALFLVAAAGVRLLLAGGSYSNSDQALGGDSSYDVALGDVDGDSDLDALVANQLANRLWLNDGSSFFSNSNQSPGLDHSRGLALGPLDADADLDLFVANSDAGNEVWLNDGSGLFTDSGQDLNPAADSRDVALGLLDGDGDLDAFVANNGANEIWLNDGAATFSLGQSLGSATSLEVALGDLDGDTDLDAYVANGSAGAEADMIWFNDGNAVFTPTTQLLDNSWNEGAALGDLDGDDDLDVFLATWFGADAVWLNDGSGAFSDTLQSLSGNGSMDVTLVDVDDDDDLDAIVAKWVPEADEIWLNDGDGNFSNSGESLDTAATYEIAAGDLDGDNDQDLFFADFGPNQIWFRGGVGLPLAWFDVDARPNDNGQPTLPWAQPGDALLPILLSFGSPNPVDVIARIESAGGVMTTTVPFAPGQTTSDLSVTNPQPDPSETMTITLSTEPGLAGLLAQFNPLSLVFVDQAQGDQACWLCFSDWLLKLLGFDTSFWMLHQMELAQLRDSPAWGYYGGLFAGHSSEIALTAASHPALLWDTFDALELWTPDVQALDDGSGGQVIVSQAMVDLAVTSIEGFRDAAGPELATLIQTELETLDPQSFVGLTMDEVADRVIERASGSIYLPLVFEAD